MDFMAKMTDGRVLRANYVLYKNICDGLLVNFPVVFDCRIHVYGPVVNVVTETVDILNLFRI